jgi:hypothetical protein
MSSDPLEELSTRNFWNGKARLACKTKASPPTVSRKSYRPPQPVCRNSFTFTTLLLLLLLLFYLNRPWRLIGLSVVEVPAFSR